MSLNVAGSRNHGKEKQVQRIDCWKVEIRFLHRRRHLFRPVSGLNHTLVIAFYNHYTGEQARTVVTSTKGKSCAPRSRKGRHALLRRKTKRSYALASPHARFFSPSCRVAARKRSSTVSFPRSRVRSFSHFPIIRNSFHPSRLGLSTLYRSNEILLVDVPNFTHYFSFIF